MEKLPSRDPSPESRAPACRLRSAAPALRRALLRWFAKHRRPLPWRRSRDPYAVWVSEIMLQQTQVATVVPYYRRFLRAFPSVERLAEAPLERVLELWSGLGYYGRARRLQAAAQRLVAKFGGRFPADFQAARSLPGVGRYTAAAVLSIAYGRPLAALDGNVARLIARLEGRKGSFADAPFRRAAEQTLERLLSRRSPGNFNQALMELGQTLCLPRSPRCSVCPLRPWCRGFRTGRPEAFPSSRPRRAPEVHHLAAALVFQPLAPGPRPLSPAGRRVLMVRGLDQGLMTDLWNFPSAFGASPAAARGRLRKKLERLASGPVRFGPELARLRHGITYRNIQVLAYRAEVSSRQSAVSSRQQAAGSSSVAPPGGNGLVLLSFARGNSRRPAPNGHSRESGNPNDTGLGWLELGRFRRAAVSELARKIARAVQAVGSKQWAVGNNCRFSIAD